MNTATKVLKLDARISPAVMHSFRRVGIRTRIVLHTNSNGETEKLYGQLGKAKIKGFISIYLTESKRYLEVNPAMIRKTEEVIVWEEILSHKNPNYKTPLIDFFWTFLDVKQISPSGGYASGELTSEKFESIRFHGIDVMTSVDC